VGRAAMAVFGTNFHGQSALRVSWIWAPTALNWIFVPTVDISGLNVCANSRHFWIEFLHQQSTALNWIFTPTTNSFECQCSHNGQIWKRMPVTMNIFELGISMHGQQVWKGVFVTIMDIFGSEYWW
jgi:hypothetical protein